MAQDPILIGIPEIADIANVSRPAVSNWRKRHDDFPEPRVQSDSGVLFELRAIEEWLLASGKIDEPIPPGALVWRFAEALRGPWSAETLFEFTCSWLCYLEACARATDDAEPSDNGRSAPVIVPIDHRWTSVREAADSDLPRRLRSAGKSIETANPQLADLLSFLAPEPFPAPPLLRSFVAELEAAADGETPRFALFEEAQAHVVEVARTSGEFTTPGDISYLLTELAGKIGDGSTVVDPAYGTGGLLLMAGVADSAPETGARFVGVDRNGSAARYARARFFLYGLDVEIDVADSLRSDLSDWPDADLVLCDPPYGLNNWGDGDVYRSPAWKYGSPPPSSADLAWIQLSLAILKPTGRAAVVLPPGSCFRGGREAMIRDALVRAGVVEAVIHLPPRLRRNISIPLVIWLLRPPAAQGGAPAPVLLVDASAVGTAGRSTHDLSAEDVEGLTRLIHLWRSERAVVPEVGLLAIVVAVEEIVAAGADLTPRRYLPSPEDVGSNDLVPERAAALGESLRATHELDQALRSIAEPTTPLDSGTAIRTRLGDIAEVLRPRVAKDSSKTMTARAGDLLVTTSTDGFAVRLLDEGDPISGLHAIVIRSIDPDSVSPSWLLLWTRTQAFASLVDRHAKGATIRSVSVKDMADFRLDVPSSEVQARGEVLAERLDYLVATQTALAKAIERLQTADLQLVYASVAP